MKKDGGAKASAIQLFFSSSNLPEVYSLPSNDFPDFTVSIILFIVVTFSSNISILTDETLNVLGEIDKILLLKIDVID